MVAAVLVASAATGCGSSTPSHRLRSPAAGSFVSSAKPVGGLPSAAVQALDLDISKAKRLGAFHLRSHAWHVVYLAPTRRGTTCVLDVGSDHVGAGCGPALSGDHVLAFVEGFDGGPRPAAMTELHVSGVASRRTRAVAVELSTGATETVTLNDANAFFYEVAADELSSGAAPTALAAFDAAGKEIERIEIRPPAAGVTP